MFIEGGCRWGFDRIWPYVDSAEVQDDELVDKKSHSPALRRLWVLLRAKQAELRKKHHEQSQNQKTAPVKAVTVTTVIAPKTDDAKTDIEAKPALTPANKASAFVAPTNYLQQTTQMAQSRQPVFSYEPMFCYQPPMVQPH